jgi:lipopolysaccharide export system permease protein
VKNFLASNILQRYVLNSFITSLGLCLLGATSLFMIFDFFERFRVFIREDADVIQVLSYLIFKLPLIVHLMMPVALLIATLISIGRLSQHSEITAMRACGVSLFWLSRPLIVVGLLMSLLMFIAGETIVPWSSQRVEEIYHFDIRKKIERGALSRANFWFRSGNAFYNIGFYDSRSSTLHGLSIYEFTDEFKLLRRIDSSEVIWNGPSIGWTMHNASETLFVPEGETLITSFNTLPLAIEDTPADFLQHERRPETLSYNALKAYAEKLRAEGVPISNYLVQLESKIAFPFVNVIVILIGFPFALVSARSGTMTRSFVFGVATGFGYYFIHAFSTALGSAELIPIIPSAWAANILLGSIGGYLMSGAEYP